MTPVTKAISRAQASVDQDHWPVGDRCDPGDNRTLQFEHDCSRLV
jgi:hypothetical protein